MTTPAELCENVIVDEKESAITHAKWRILPFLFLCFVVNYVDRINVAFAKLQFQQSLGFSDAVYGLGISLFFVGYLLFEVPSNLLLSRTGARKTLTRIMFIWGLASIGMMFMKTPLHFYLLRLLIGAGEAGFMPGVVLYLSYWFPTSHRARITSFFFAALPISSVIGNPISGWIMHTLGGAHGLANWQWLFLLEGLPGVLLGIIAFFYLTDRPRDARWLSNSERTALASAVEGEERLKQSPAHVSSVRLLGDLRIYCFILAVFTQFCVANVFAFWGPTLLRASGVKDLWHIGLLNTVPYLVATCFMAAVAWHSDKRMERRWHAATGQFITVAGLLLLPGILSDTALVVTILAVVASGHYIFWSVFWTIPPTYLRAGSAPVGIALISSVAVTGAIFASNFIAWSKTVTGSFGAGFYAIAGLAAFGALILLLGVPAELLKRSRG